jgi:hypothetical protein
MGGDGRGLERMEGNGRGWERMTLGEKTLRQLKKEINKGEKWGKIGESGKNIEIEKKKRKGVGWGAEGGVGGGCGEDDGEWVRL